MLEHLTFTGRELLLAVLLASLIYLLEVWLFSRRGKAKASAADEARLAALETEVAGLRQRLQALEVQPPAGSSLDRHASAYAEAQRMAREGAAAMEMAASLGISRAEAELIIALQRGESSSS